MSVAAFLKHPAMSQIRGSLLRYLATGGFAFLIDAGMTEAIVRMGGNVFVARAFAMTVAMCVAYMLHRRFTFSDSRLPVGMTAQFVGFVLCQLATGFLNYAVFYWLMHILPQPVGFFGRMFSICCGVGTGLVGNFVLLRFLVFPSAAFAEDSIRACRRLAVLYVGLVFFLFLGPVIKHFILLHDFAWDKASYGMADPDIWMRLTQVRQWVTGSDFFDHAMRKIDAPFGQITTPWTRPVDAILSFFYFLTPANMAVNARLLYAALWMSPLAAAVAAIFLARTALLRYRHTYVMFGLFAFIFLVPFFLGRFSPGDADHHGVLSMLWCAVIWLVAGSPLSRAKAALLGAILGLMLWISPEALAIIALVYGCLGCFALFRHAEAKPLFIATLAAAAVSAVAVMVEMPFPDAVTRQVYDSISIVHVVLLGMTAGLMGLLSSEKVGGLDVWRGRAPLYVLAAAMVGAVMGVLFPKFLHGPLADVDPFIFKHFIPYVSEARPLWQMSVRQIFEITYPVILAAIILFYAASPKASPFKKRQRLVLTLSAFLLITLAMVIWHVRWAYYLEPVAIVSIAAFLPGVSARAVGGPFGEVRRIGRRWRFIVVFVFCCYLIYIGRFLCAPEPLGVATLCERGPLRMALQSGQLVEKLGDRPLIIYVPPDQGGDTVFFTPYRIVASNYHREGKGLADLYDLQTAHAAEDALPVLTKRQINALFYCPGTLPKSSWLRKMGEGEISPPKWLKPVTGLKFNPGDKEVPVLYKVSGKLPHG
jgi:putative flippase GtrA